MKPPKLMVMCEGYCREEANCHPPEYVAWSWEADRWLCNECWGGGYNPEYGKRPLVYAKDALLDPDEQLRRLIAVAAANRIGV